MTFKLRFSRLKWLFLSIVSSFVFLSCTDQENVNYPDVVRFAIKKAGKNKSELKKVLDYYLVSPQDSLKYRAACFLVENMPYYHYYEGGLLDEYGKIYETLATSRNSPQEILDSFVTKYGHFSRSKLKKKEDIKTIKSDYLIHQIEWAFKVWDEQPWGKSIGFKDFCEYVLPYRIDDEQPMRWREVFYEKYNPLLDSLRNSPDATDPYMAACEIINMLCKTDKRFTTILPDLPHAGPYLCEQWRSGSCRELTDLTIYVLRALGIAYGTDFIPILSKADSGHEWAFILDKSGYTYTSDYLDCETPASEKVRHYAPKVYRKTFSVNRELETQMHSLDKSTPPFFVIPKYIDVTLLYSGRNPINSVVIPNDEWYSQKVSGKIAYLCVPSKQSWKPVMWTPFKRHNLTFDYVKTNTVFRVATWEKGCLFFQTDPFIADVAGITHFLKAEPKTESICLFSKYNSDVEFFTLRMIGGIFEASNQCTFIPSDTLCTIPYAPIRMLNKVIIGSKAYKYVRYKGVAGSYCDVAEVAFYEHKDDTVPLPGKIIGTSNLLGTYDRNDYVKALDGNPYTSFHYKNPSGGWVGLEFEQATNLSKIIYTPRNRDNFQGNRIKI